MTLTQQLIAVIRDVPGYFLGAPARAVVRLHHGEEIEPGEAMCFAHRRPTMWPCPDYLNAAESLDAHPSWRIGLDQADTP